VEAKHIEASHLDRTDRRSLAEEKFSLRPGRQSQTGPWPVDHTGGRQRGSRAYHGVSWYGDG